MLESRREGITEEMITYRRARLEILDEASLKTVRGPATRCVWIPTQANIEFQVTRLNRGRAISTLPKLQPLTDKGRQIGHRIA